MSSQDDSKKVKKFITYWGGYISVYLAGGICGYILHSCVQLF